VDDKIKRTLPVKSIASVAEQAVNYIDRRRKGLEPFLDTGFPKLNTALLNGME